MRCPRSSRTPECLSRLESRGTLLARYYMDCRPPDETPGIVRLMAVNAADYERDAQPLSGATADMFEDSIFKGTLPPLELYFLRA